MNAVTRNIQALSDSNYVINPKPGNQYWFSLSFKKTESYKRRFGEKFYIVINGDKESEVDYFVIPYSNVKSVLVEENIGQEKVGSSTRKRWNGRIVDKYLHVTRSNVRIDLSGYYGNSTLLQDAMLGRQIGYLSPLAGASTFREEEPFTPSQGDWRPLTNRQIKERRGQQKFRDALRARYGDCCMVSQCNLMDVVEAAHIKPYRGANDHHPSNGLLLRADLHTLFDLDLLGIEPNALAVRIHPDAMAAYGAFDGVRLTCPGKRPSSQALRERWQSWRGHGLSSADAVESASSRNASPVNRAQPKARGL